MNESVVLGGMGCCASTEDGGGKKPAVKPGGGGTDTAPTKQTAPANTTSTSAASAADDKTGANATPPQPEPSAAATSTVVAAPNSGATGTGSVNGKSSLRKVSIDPPVTNGTGSIRRGASVVGKESASPQPLSRASPASPNSKKAVTDDPDIGGASHFDDEDDFDPLFPRGAVMLNEVKIRLEALESLPIPGLPPPQPQRKPSSPPTATTSIAPPTASPTKSSPTAAAASNTSPAKTSNASAPAPATKPAAPAASASPEDTEREDSTVRMEDLGLQHDLDLSVDDLAADPAAMNEAFDKTLESAAAKRGGAAAAASSEGAIDVEIEVDSSDGEYESDEDETPAPLTATSDRKSNASANANVNANAALSPPAPRTSISQLRVSPNGKISLTRAQAEELQKKGALRMRDSKSGPQSNAPAGSSSGGGGGGGGITSPLVGQRLPTMKEEDESPAGAGDRKNSVARSLSRSALTKSSDPHKRITAADFALLQAQLNGTAPPPTDSTHPTPNSTANGSKQPQPQSAQPQPQQQQPEKKKKKKKRPTDAPTRPRTKITAHGTLRLNKNGTARIEQAQEKAAAAQKKAAANAAATAAGSIGRSGGGMSAAKQTQVLSSAVSLTSFVMQLPATGVRFILEGNRPSAGGADNAGSGGSAGGITNITQVTMDLVGEPFWAAMSEGLGWAARMGVKMFKNLFPLKLCPWYLNPNDFLTTPKQPPPSQSGDEKLAKTLFRATIDIGVSGSGLLDKHLEKVHILNLLRKLSGSGGGRDGRPDAPVALVFMYTTKLKSGREAERMLCMLRTTAKTLLSSLAS